MKRNSAVFILTFGRPNNIKTLKALQGSGYTGKIFLLCSDDDKSLVEYQKIYPGMVFVFNKQKYRNLFDMADNSQKENSVIFARNYNFLLAKELGLTHFIQLDDDYTCFEHMRITDSKIIHKKITNINVVFDAFFDFLDNTPTTSIAFAQTGDFMGGAESNIFSAIRRKRKLMNTFINKTDRPYTFHGRMNDDVNCYLVNGMRGVLFFTHPYCSTLQTETQKSKGGLTEMYKENGTYVKSFYSIIFNPSAVKISMMGVTSPRIHHRISWDNAVPCIISEQHKK